MSRVVAVDDHRIDADRAVLSELLLGRGEQPTGEPATSMAGVHGHAIQVRSPSVPADDHTAEDGLLLHRQEERSRVTGDKRLDGL